MDESNSPDSAQSVGAESRTRAAKSVIDPVLEQYYSCFNERRFVDAGMLFAEDAVLEQLPAQRQERGAMGYLQFVSAWLRAFPDAVFTARDIGSADGVTYEVDLAATGTHQGALDLGGWVFRATGTRATFRIRELLQVHDGRITFSSLTFDLHEIIDKLATVDVRKLIDHLQSLQRLTKQLTGVDPDSNRAREIIHTIGHELDIARHTIRPYYKR